MISVTTVTENGKRTVRSGSHRFLCPFPEAAAPSAEHDRKKRENPAPLSAPSVFPSKPRTSAEPEKLVLVELFGQQRLSQVEPDRSEG